MDAAEAKRVTEKAAKKRQQEFITALMLAIQERASQGYASLPTSAIQKMYWPSTYVQEDVVTALKSKGYEVNTFSVLKEDELLIHSIYWK